MSKGGNTERAHEEMTTRRELVHNHLISNPDKPMKFNELTSLFEVSDWTMRKDIAAIAEEDASINFLRGAVVYVPPTRYSGNKNEEGYSDPTAAAAIESVEPKVIKTNAENVRGPKPGDVWDVKCASGGTGKFLVLAVNEINDGRVYVTCVEYKPEHEMMLESCKKLYCKPAKYFVERTWGTPLSLLTEYKNVIRDYLEIDPEEKVVEKVVEVPVEKIVEKVVEVPEVQVAEPVSSGKLYTQEELDMEIVKMRAEIYKECLYLMAGRKEM